MAWRECNVEDERFRFVARLLDREKMPALACKFGLLIAMKDTNVTWGALPADCPPGLYVQPDLDNWRAAAQEVDVWFGDILDELFGPE